MRNQTAAVTAAAVLATSLWSAPSASAQGILDFMSRDTAQGRGATMPPHHAQFAAELKSAASVIDGWNFVSPELNTAFRTKLAEIRLENYSTGTPELRTLPNGRVLVELSFTTQENSPIVTETAAALVSEKLLPALGPIVRGLREEHHFGRFNADVDLVGNQLILSCIVEAGMLLTTPEPLTQSIGIFTLEERGKTLARTIGTATEANTPALTVPAVALVSAAQQAIGLRDFYRAAGEKKLASLAQAIAVDLAPSPEHYHLYSNLGRLTDQDVAEAPLAVRDLVKRVNEVASTIPPLNKLVERNQARGSQYQVSEVCGFISRLETATEACSSESIDRALLELALAGSHVAAESRLAQTKDPARVAEMIRHYLIEKYKYQYVPHSGLNGLSDPIASHLLDCSSICLMCWEQFQAAGVEGIGIETIGMRGQDGAQNPDVMAHAYLYADTAEGRVYFDFSMPSSMPYQFNDRGEIWRLYAGERQGEVMVTLSSAAPDQILSQLCFEHFLDAKQALAKAFKASPMALQELLVEHPELASAARTLKRAYRVLADMVEGEKAKADADALDRGTVEDLRRILD